MKSQLSRNEVIVLQTLDYSVQHWNYQRNIIQNADVLPTHVPVVKAVAVENKQSALPMSGTEL